MDPVSSGSSRLRGNSGFADTFVDPLKLHSRHKLAVSGLEKQVGTAEVEGINVVISARLSFLREPTPILCRAPFSCHT